MSQLGGYFLIALGLVLIGLTVPATASVIGIAADPGLLVAGVISLLAGLQDLSSKKRRSGRAFPLRALGIVLILAGAIAYVQGYHIVAQITYDCIGFTVPLLGSCLGYPVTSNLLIEIALLVVGGAALAVGGKVEV